MKTNSLVLLAMLMACGSTMPGPGGTGGGSSSTTGGLGGTCCLNGSFYQCDSKAAFDKCAGFDVGACNDACSASDFTCHDRCFQMASSATHDPSACTRDSSRDNTCGSGGGGGSGDTCLGIAGVACSYSTQCSSGNCTDGHCYGNAVGDRCNYSTQCSSGNCTDGCCRGNSTGSKCNYSTQCDSGNCTNGRCQ